MRLISVDITNYRVLRRAAFRLPDALIGIIGPNGAGKSSLVEAISWALYGQQAARSARAEVKSTFARSDEYCEVTLGFEVRGVEHAVTRRLVGAGQRLEVELRRAGEVAVVGSTETQQYIEKLLGLDWRGYVTSVYARQSDLDAFSSFQPAKRREHLVAMLGIDRLDRAIDRVKSDLRLDAEKAVLLEKQAAPTGEMEAALRRLRERLGAIATELGQATGARESEAEKLGQIEARHAEHERKKALCSELKAQQELARAGHRHLSGQAEQLKVEKAGLERLRIKVEQSRPQLEQLESMRTEVRKMEKARESAAAQKRIRGELENSQGQLSRVEETVKELVKRLTELEKSLAEHPTPGSTELEAVRTELEKERERYLSLSEQKKQAEREGQKIRDSVSQIAKLGGEAVCSRCLRPYGSDMERIRKHLEEELAQIESQALKIDTDQRKSAQAGAALKEKVKSVESLLEQGRARQQALELATSQRQQAETQRGLLGERVQSLERQLAEIGETSFDERAWQEASSRLAALEKLSRETAEADGQLKRLPVVEESFARLATEIAAAQTHMEELDKQRLAVGFDERQFAASKAELEQATAAAKAANDRYVEAAHAKDLLTAEASRTESRLGELRQLAEELKNVRAHRTRIDRLAKIFGDLKHTLVAGIRPRLAEIGSELLDEMTAGRYTVMELDEDYNISIADNGQSFGIDRFSGGETDLANLCLRLAVSLALAESAGLERSLVILDEVFGSQDESRRELIYQGLAGLKPRFPQIIAITHIEELKNKVETLIEIVPTGNGWSEVRVDGAVA
ncbi:hypothetical protein C3F09_10635 [candidate division GN15 bacterium]|uniref:AAA+ ATPase domain-containing protein n=1 Tax=candidate division GN15 bacterium TaxID=2072418 RepID=A0A855WW78_9BACT|nr:MAG: hypothetical protein C3F09_10635 [candidate division GN15 bacterium]